jgi:hypothetical protein
MARRQIRVAAAGFMALGVAALAFDVLSRNPEQMRYVLGAAFLIGLSAIIFHQARD